MRIGVYAALGAGPTTCRLLDGVVPQTTGAVAGMRDKSLLAAPTAGDFSTYRPGRSYACDLMDRPDCIPFQEGK